MISMAALLRQWADTHDLSTVAAKLAEHADAHEIEAMLRGAFTDGMTVIVETLDQVAKDNVRAD